MFLIMLTCGQPWQHTPPNAGSVTFWSRRTRWQWRWTRKIDGS